MNSPDFTREAEPQSPPAEQENGTSRLEAFSDGVFAIAITLLVLEVKVPDFEQLKQKGVSLLEFLGDQWPVYVAYLTSFLTIGIIWINHHVMFKYIIRSDRMLLNLNLLLLLAVSFIPYPTDLLGEAVKYQLAAATNNELSRANADTTAAAVLYVGTMLAMAVAFYSLWAYAVRGMRLVDQASDPAHLRNRQRANRLGVLVYVAAFIIAFFNVIVAVGLTLVVALFFFLPNAGDRF